MILWFFFQFNFLTDVFLFYILFYDSCTLVQVNFYYLFLKHVWVFHTMKESCFRKLLLQIAVLSRKWITHHALS